MSVAIPIPLLQNLPDVNVTPGAPVDEYALTYDHDTARFVLRAPFAGLLATGATVGATSQAQAFTLGVVSPFIAPAADGTTAWQVRKADKTTSVLNVDTTSARVGIGTDAPSGTLHVRGENTSYLAMYYSSFDGSTAGNGVITYYRRARGIVATPEPIASGDLISKMAFSGYTSGGTYVPGAGIEAYADANPTSSTAFGRLSFHTTDSNTGVYTERLRINSVGNVGIGTAGPSAKLHVISAIGGSGSGIKLEQLAENTSLASSYAPIDFVVPISGIIGQFLVTAANYVGSNKNLPANSIALWAEAASGTLSLAAGGASGDIRFNTGGYAVANERMRVTSAGNVGINDTAPAEKLDVTGNANVTGVYKVDDVQVLSNRVIDARCADVANSGDATTDGLIDALRDAMVAHGLVAAS